MVKLRVAIRKIADYIRHDLKEIALPSSLPDPPSYMAHQGRRLTPAERMQVVREAWVLYKASWRHTLWGQELEVNESGKKKKEDEPTLAEELSAIAKAGANGAVPMLQQLYLTRAAAYRDGLRSFVQGYQEGIAEVMEKEKEQLNTKTSSSDGQEEKEQLNTKSSASDGLADSGSSGPLADNRYPNSATSTEGSELHKGNR
ncbi:hypothetical protein CBR_g45657 [Chara braunii]|uniref:Uncharacterized protein n=1 Tax=Chara braunii TaxID=69332 RepID=A0A388K3G9_CHABU|nr:hypothetical protein CBR_g45657 [Chara braunii]|eukprot:GBG64600.1 hypothetical protein CBR_g45657 [Chara braunii]